MSESPRVELQAFPAADRLDHGRREAPRLIRDKADHSSTPMIGPPDRRLRPGLAALHAGHGLFMGGVLVFMSGQM
jgi:hypothetical protein